MQILPLLGAFCCGLAVIYLVRRWSSESLPDQVKVFTSLTAVVAMGGALLFLGANLGPAPWPVEFWAYPVGVLVALILWKKRGEGSDAYTFKIVVTALVAIGIISLVVPETWLPKPFAAILHSVGEAVFIAGALAATVDHYIKQRTYREISADVFKYLIGYALPDEFKERIRELVTNSDLIRRECRIDWKITPLIEGEATVFFLGYGVFYKLQNISRRRVRYQFQTSKAIGDDPESAVVRLWGSFPNRVGNYNNTGDLLAPGPPDSSGRSWISGNEVWIDAENVRHGLEFTVGADYESRLHRQFDYHVFKKPTLGACVAVEHPTNYRVFLSPDSGKEPDVRTMLDGRVISTWQFDRLFFNEDAIFVRWALKQDMA